VRVSFRDGAPRSGRTGSVSVLHTWSRSCGLIVRKPLSLLYPLPGHISASLGLSILALSGNPNPFALEMAA
jgi:hypothetical protein